MICDIMYLQKTGKFQEHPVLERLENVVSITTNSDGTAEVFFLDKGVQVLERYAWVTSVTTYTETN